MSDVFPIIKEYKAFFLYLYTFYQNRFSHFWNEFKRFLGDYGAK